MITTGHNPVEIGLRKPRTANDLRTTNSRFDIRRADWERFNENLKDLSGSRLGALGLRSAKAVERMAGELQEVILEACEKSMPRKRVFRKSNRWWMTELTKLKKEVSRKRKMIKHQKDQKNKGLNPKLKKSVLYKNTKSPNANTTGRSEGRSMKAGKSLSQNAAMKSHRVLYINSKRTN